MTTLIATNHTQKKTYGANAAAEVQNIRAATRPSPTARLDHPTHVGKSLSAVVPIGPDMKVHGDPKESYCRYCQATR